MARKLRVSPLTPPLRIVLVEPEIPQNTGNIARLCAATQAELHLVGRLGFRIDEKAVKRAGLDYWHLVSLSVHPDLRTFELKNPSAKLHLFSANAKTSYLEMDVAPGDALVFGKESSGLPRDLLARHEARSPVDQPRERSGGGRVRSAAKVRRSRGRAARRRRERRGFSALNGRSQRVEQTARGAPTRDRPQRSRATRQRTACYRYAS